MSEENDEKLRAAGFKAAQFVRSDVSGPDGVVLEAQHRYEDLELIAEVLRHLKPRAMMELGTAGGGFALFAAVVLAEWHGRVVTIDKAPLSEAAGAAFVKQGNIVFWHREILTRRADDDWMRGQQIDLVYCDDGDKERELDLYARPDVRVIGCHDYGTEVRPEWAEALMRERGFRPLWHERFEALAHPEFYPMSLTRFWERA